MKKLTVFFASMALIAMTSVAWAIPTTWTDTIDFTPDILIPPTVNYTHNIADNGFSSFFMGGNDTISSYVLSLSLYDDNLGTRINRWLTLSDGGEIAAILTTGGIYSYNFDLASDDFTGNFLGTLDLFADGRLSVTVASLWGDFYLASSELTAYGDNGTAPVPEPGTIVLLGVGLLGLGFFGKRRMNKA